MPRHINSIWFDKNKVLESTINSVSISECVRKLGLKSNSGNRKYFKYYCTKYNIQIPVFDPKTAVFTSKHLSMSNYFKENTRPRSACNVRKLLINKYNFKEECSECNQLPEWNGKPLTLQIDHIDGNRMNNLITNLRFLCPNCHSQTDTYGNKKLIIEEKYLCSCGNKKSKTSKNCYKCANILKIGKTVINYPEIDIILKMIQNTGSMVGAAKIIGVSDNGLKKYLQRNNIKL